MTKELAVTPLDIGDKGFMIASSIERCPKGMMLPELFRNAVEAVSHKDYDGPREISFYAADEGEHVPGSKLAIWNAGRGMSALELKKMADLASTINKKLALDANFGMGAKVASLPSNQLGMIYRSCKDGKVSLVMLCKRDGVYGRYRWPEEDSTFSEIIDVSDEFDESERVSDWTQVVLLGNRAEQDTVNDPYDSDPPMQGKWIPVTLYHRFFRIPDGTSVILKEGTHSLDNDRKFKTLWERMQSNVFERSETVEAAHGINIHYVYDAPFAKAPGHNKSFSGTGSMLSDAAIGSIVFKDEMYDVRKSYAWARVAPMFGITFGSKHLSVHIELPEDYPVYPEGYREFLRKKSGDQAQLSLVDFAELARVNMPQWVKDIVKSMSPESEDTQELQAELQKLLNSLSVYKAKVDPSGDTYAEMSGAKQALVMPGQKVQPSEQHGGQKLHKTTIIPKPAGAKKITLAGSVDKAPDVQYLETEEQVQERGLINRAGELTEDGSVLYINTLYQSVIKMKEELEKEYAHVKDADAMRELVHQQARFAIALNVGRAVVFAIAKQLYSHWDFEAVRKACTPEALSIVADDYKADFQTVKRRLSAKFGTSKAA